VDLRGWGETKPNPPGKKAKFSWDEFFAWRSFEMGRPLLGMRVNDLLGVVRQMSPTYRKIYLLGVEAGGLVALHAAALDPSIAGVAAYNSLTSWTDAVEAIPGPATHAPVSSFVPGALRDYDIPDLIRALAPRPVVASGAAHSANDILRGLKLI
jgi:pimeloyl-ACP methyl ester carboxylesterase